jgi:hypothetical protein
VFGRTRVTTSPVTAVRGEFTCGPGGPVGGWGGGRQCSLLLDAIQYKALCTRRSIVT